MGKNISDFSDNKTLEICKNNSTQITPLLSDVLLLSMD